MKTVFTWGGPAYGKPDLISVRQAQSKSALFQISYGLQVKKGLTYSQACTELGSCLLHALACDGAVNNDGE